MPIPADVAHHRAVRAANTRWARPGERERHATKISAAKLRRHEALVDPDGRLDPAERRVLAENSLKVEMAGLALKAAKAEPPARRGVTVMSPPDAGRGPAGQPSSVTIIHAPPAATPAGHSHGY